jgi:hypothetical protein
MFVWIAKNSGKKKKKTKKLLEQVSGCLARFYEDPLTKSRKIVENLYFFK